MAEEIAFENDQISNFEELVALTLDRVYCIPSCITHRPLRMCKISLKSKKLFVDGRMYTWTDGHLRPALLGRPKGEIRQLNIGQQKPPLKETQ